jgi:metal-dependent amidase/aminoacylase/carboxypeptidase family protein
MYDALKPDAWLAETVRSEMTRLGRSPIEQALEAALPLGSTDMGNVTQLLPGIHPMVAVDAGGASLHQADFTAAAAGPSADKAVVDGAIMLARTVVRLAESPGERDRVLEARAQRVAL